MRGVESVGRIQSGGLLVGQASACVHMKTFTFLTPYRFPCSSTKSPEARAAHLHELATLRRALDAVLADATRSSASGRLPLTLEIDPVAKHEAAVDDKVVTAAGTCLLGSPAKGPPAAAARRLSVCARSSSLALSQWQSPAYLQPPQPADPLATPSLVTEVFDFLALAPPPSPPMAGNEAEIDDDGGGSGRSNAVPDMKGLRTTLHVLSRVCRLWRDVALGDRYWRAPAAALLPAMTAAAAPAAAEEKGGRGYRRVRGILNYRGKDYSRPSIRRSPTPHSCDLVFPRCCWSTVGAWPSPRSATATTGKPASSSASRCVT